MKFGLIGHPIAHSLSPALFKAGYNGRYPYELIETPYFEEAYERFLEEYDGINVTAPFKELAYTKADIVSEECRLIGATNLLIKTPEGVIAYNSDYRGLLLWLQKIIHEEVLTFETDAGEKLPFPKEASKNILIVGLGGAGKAAAVAAWKTGLKVTLMNRDISKAEKMAECLGKNVSVCPLTEFPKCFNEADIVIYNLPVRIPEIDKIRLCRTKGNKRLLEANYLNPTFDQTTRDEFKKEGLDIEYHSGHTWLLLQALTGYELFTGEKPDLSQMARQI